MPRPSVAEKRATFRKLHESGCWMIPNPWDVGSARYLQGLGFKALASTSSGFAWSVAQADTAVDVDTVLAHLKEIVDVTDVPVNADFEGGYADEPADVAANVTRCCAAGVAGLSIEDSTGDKDKPLYDIPFAVERMKAARAAIDKAAPDVLLTGRAEGFIAGGGGVRYPSNWTPPPFPPAKVLEGRYCRLEPLDVARHGADIAAAFVGAH